MIATLNYNSVENGNRFVNESGVVWTVTRTGHDFIKLTSAHGGRLALTYPSLSHYLNTGYFKAYTPTA